MTSDLRRRVHTRASALQLFAGMSNKRNHHRRRRGGFPDSGDPVEAKAHLYGIDTRPGAQHQIREAEWRELTPGGAARLPPDAEARLPAALAVRLYNAVLAAVTQPFAVLGEVVRHPFASVRAAMRALRGDQPHEA